MPIVGGGERMFVFKVGGGGSMLLFSVGGGGRMVPLRVGGGGSIWWLLAGGSFNGGGSTLERELMLIGARNPEGISNFLCS